MSLYTSSFPLINSLQSTLEGFSRRDEHSFRNGDMMYEKLVNLERLVQLLLIRQDKQESFRRERHEEHNQERLLQDCLSEILRLNGVIALLQQENAALRSGQAPSPSPSSSSSSSTSVNSYNPGAFVSTPTSSSIYTPSSATGQYVGTPTASSSVVSPPFVPNTTTNTNNPTAVSPTNTPRSVMTNNNSGHPPKPSVSFASSPISSPGGTHASPPASASGSSFSKPPPSNKRPPSVPRPGATLTSSSKSSTSSGGAKQSSRSGSSSLANGDYNDDHDDAPAPEPEQHHIPPSQQRLHVDYPLNYNTKRRFSVSAAPPDLNMDLTPAPRNIVKKSEEVQHRIKSVITNNILFKSLDEQFDDLIDEMFEVRLTADEVIIRQGDTGDNFYIVDKGELYVLYRDVVVATIGSGKGFGEIALMYEVPRTATVRAKTECILWGMSRTTFRRTLMAHAIKKRTLYENFLSKVPLLAGLLPYERATIADALESKLFKDGEYIIRQGDRGDKFYILERGGATAFKDSTEVKHYSEGDYFGELALLADKPRAADVRATGDVRVLFLSREDFAAIMGPCEEILKRNSTLYQQLQGGLSSSDSTMSPLSMSSGTAVTNTNKSRTFQEVLKEFTTEEGAYLRGLDVTVKEFLQPLRRESESGAISSISPEDVSTLFSHLEMLLNIHRTFAAEVIPQLTDPVSVGKHFNKLVPSLFFYRGYYSDFHQAQELYETKKNDDHFKAFLKTSPRSNFDLLQLIRAPIDRIPKLLSFLKEVQLISKDDPDVVDAANKFDNFYSELSKRL